MEGLNNAIQGWIKKTSGYRNQERFQNRYLLPLRGIGPLSRPMKNSRNIPEEAIFSAR
jgi:hypothetical protein